MIKTGSDKGKMKERKKRGSRKYGQAKLRQARKGMISLSLAAVVAAALAGMLLLAYVTRGKAALYVGGIGMAALCISVAGVIMACRGFKERDKRYTGCRAAIVLHVLLVAGMTAIFFRGLL